MMETIQQLEMRANELRQQGKLTECRQTLEQAIQLARARQPQDLTELARLINNLGFAAKEMSDHKHAEQYFQLSLSLERRIGNPDNPEMAVTLQHVGRYAHLRQDYDTSWKCWTEALEIWKRLVLGKQQYGYTVYLASALHALGEFFADTGQFDFARQNFEQALTARESILPPDHPDIIENLGNLGKLCTYTKDYSAACTYLKRAVPLYLKELGPEHRETQQLQNLLRQAETYLSKVN
jgi:tetratricopeptide (TPR) repeat protein